MRDVLVTGATGLIGGEIVVQLLRRGAERIWCLVRGNAPEQAEQRLRRRLLLPRHADVPVTREEIALGQRVRVVNGDLTRPQLGIAADLLGALRPALSAIIHCAAELSFDDSADCYAANCDGLRQVLDFAVSCPQATYVHFSTAACCGKRTDEVVSEAAPPLARDAHWNAYAHSKALGEALVRAHGERLRSLIVRPPLTLPDCYTDRRLVRSILWALSVISRMDFIPISQTARIDLVGASFVAQATLGLLARYSQLPATCYHLSAGQEWAISPSDLLRIAREDLGKKDEFKLAQSTGEGLDQLQRLTDAEKRRMFQAASSFLPFFNSNTVYDNALMRGELPELFTACEAPARFLPRLVRLYHFGHAEHEVAMLTR